jgi:hypothetical protein
MVKHKLITVLFIIIATIANSQFTDRYWTFGDSAAIDFSNLSNPAPAVSMLRSRGTCASICDSTGALLFYCGSPQVPPWPSASGGLKYGYTVNKNHQLMDNGDRLFGGAWYQEMIIIPDPGDINKFYVFTAGVVAPVNGLCYSVVDLSMTGGLGKVVQKNIQLNLDTLCDGISAVKHGNGRDWWLISKSSTNNVVPTNKIFTYLISPSGISLGSIQYIGVPQSGVGFIRSKFNNTGNHLYNVSASGLIERYDFDRCAGLFSNSFTISPVTGMQGYYWGFELSPDESKLYTTPIYQTANQDSSYLLQFDLNAPNFLASADTLAAFLAPDLAGLLQKAPDDKIYLSVTWAGADACTDYLYCYSTVNTTNSSISVINSPDSAGAACDFQPFSFYLGGHKAYTGLPNNPNYELGALIGSPCDTLSVGVEEVLGYESNLSLFYDPSWQIAFVNAKGLKGKQYKLEIFNVAGQLVLEENGRLDSEYYTSDVALTSVGNGMYVVRLSTDKEVLTGKFVKY